MRTGFAATDDKFTDLRAEMRSGFAATDGKFTDIRGEMRAGFARTDDRFDALERTLILGLIGLIGTLLAVVLTVA